MRRFFALVMLFAIAESPTSVFGDENALFDRIRKAKETYERDSKELRDDVLTRLKKAEDTARQTGNKTLVDKIKEETDALESNGTPPSVISTRDYLRKLRRSRETLEELYIETIKALTKAGMDDEAGTIEKELGQFQVAAKIFQGKHYAVVKSQMSWREARLACEGEGGHLAVVNSESEANYLVALLKAEGARAAFIGATDEQREGNWFWVDGRRVSYSNWDREHRQPNNRGNAGQPEHHAAILLEYDGKWWDVPNAPGEAFICQWD